MEQLIRRSQQGDRESMGRLYTVMHDELLAQCRRYAANDCDAEDLLHDAFLLIFTQKSYFLTLQYSLSIFPCLFLGLHHFFNWSQKTGKSIA